MNVPKRPEGWKGKKEVFTKINDNVNKFLKENRNERAKTTFNYLEYDPRVQTGDYNLLENGHQNGQKQHKGGFITGPSKTAYRTSGPTHRPRPASHIDPKRSHKTSLNLNLSTTSSQNPFNDIWILDCGADIHVCNNAKRHGFRYIRPGDPEDATAGGKSEYHIEAWGNVDIDIDTPNGPAYITLLNVALIPGYKANVISTDILAEKGVYWSSQYPKQLTTKGGEIFMYAYAVGRHYAIQPLKSSGTFTTTKISMQPVTAKYTAKEVHNIYIQLTFL